MATFTFDASFDDAVATTLLPMCGVNVVPVAPGQIHVEIFAPFGPDRLDQVEAVLRRITPDLVRA